MNNTDVPTNCSEGTLLVIPLRNGGFARGIISRYNSDRGAFGYFFGPRLNDVPGEDQFNDIVAANAVFIAKFGDEGIKNGKWIIAGHLDGFNRRAWPMPHFVCDTDNGDQLQVVEYDEDTLRVRKVFQAWKTDANNLPRDTWCGYGFVEIKLTRLLADG